MSGKSVVVILLVLNSYVWAYDRSDYDWKTYNGHSYALTIDKGTWTDAEAEATAIGGRLVTINDLAENNWLFNDFLGVPSPVGNNCIWIGLYRDGSWRWANGESLTFKNWAPGEPSNSPPGENYGTIAGGKGAMWNDWGPGRPDYKPSPGIIELEAMGKHTLTISSTDGGSVTAPGIGSFPYDEGTSVPIIAKANTGYHFVNWTGTAVTAGKVANPTAASTTVIVSADYTLRANFEADSTSPEQPVIIDVRSAYCSSATQAYYIENVPLLQEFTAEVDWGQSTPDQIRWYRGNPGDTLIATDRVTGNIARRSFNVGTDFVRGEKLYVQAIASSDDESPKYPVNFDVIEAPPCIPATLLSVVRACKEIR